MRDATRGGACWQQVGLACREKHGEMSADVVLQKYFDDYVWYIHEARQCSLHTE